MLPAKRLARLIILALIAVAGNGSAAPPEHTRPVLDGQPQLRQLLRQEMQALLQGLQHISAALPQGQWQTVAEEAGAMHDSYILQQNLSAAERQTLRQSLPGGFIQLDKRFHRYAGRMQRAATARDAELSAHFLARAIETCVQCHRRFAPQRFPALAPAAPQDTHCD